METEFYKSILLRQAESSDLKMMDNEKIVLKINVLVWVKDIRKSSSLEFFGPICLTNHTKKSELEKINLLLQENRIYVINDAFTFIPDTIISNAYGIVQ